MPVQIVDRDSKHILISGQGLIFGDNGSGMPPITTRTDLMLGLVPRKPILFEHGAAINGFDGPIGEAIHETPVYNGVWVDALLDLTAPGVTKLIPELEAERLGWSPGAHMPLIRLNRGVFTRWGIIEWSLTSNPRDWRIMGRQRVNHKQETLFLVAQDGLIYEPSSGRVLDFEELQELDFHGLAIAIRCEDASISTPPDFATIYTNQ